MDTIKSSAEISELFSHGRRIHTSSISLIVRERTVEGDIKGTSQHGLCGRVAFIAGKKNGNAVWRNSAKRRMRAVCRDLGGPWQGFDVVFLAKPSICRQSYHEILNECSHFIHDKGITR